MARRQRQSAYEDAIEAFSKLPWHICLVLALLSWVLFHWMAQMKPPPVHSINEMGQTVRGSMFMVAGMFLQYLAPLIFVMAAVLSFFNKNRRQKLLAETERRTSTSQIQELSWREFEQLVGAYFEKQGYQVSFTPDGADGGVDVVAKKGKEIFLIQCKHWKSTQVGVSVVRELFGVMSARGATGAYVVSIGPFSPDAHAFTDGRNIQLLDAKKLIASSRMRTQPGHVSSSTPTCPQCGSSMIRRVAKQGANAGKSFYGCSSYPRCRGTRPA